MLEQEEVELEMREVAYWKMNHGTLLLAMTYYSDWTRSKEPISFSEDSSFKAKVTKPAHVARKLNDSCTIKRALKRKAQRLGKVTGRL